MIMTTAQRLIYFFNQDKLPHLLGLKLTRVEAEHLEGELVIDDRHLRPGGIMNGGISLLIIETFGSMSSWLHLNPETQNAFGIQVNANHIAIAKPGDCLHIKTIPVHIGRSTHIWDVVINHQSGKLVSSGRITMMVTEKPI
jgi:1,4-dihydroxy-2-naphthoyl-CoA hydrolase